MLTNTQFLHARGFSDSTIMSKLFTDRIFNIKDERFRYNIAFPIWNKDEKIVGMESRNDGFKGFFAKQRPFISDMAFKCPRENRRSICC